MKNWDANNMQPYTCGRTVAYNFNRVVDSADPNDHIYKDFSQSSYGAELVPRLHHLYQGECSQ